MAQVELVMRGIRNERDAETVHILAKKLADGQIHGPGSAAFRACCARDPAILRVLEEMAEQLERIGEAQQGQTRRSSTRWFTPEPEEVQVWRKAFVAADAGEPNPGFAFLYGAAAIHAGIVPYPYGL